MRNKWVIKRALKMLKEAEESLSIEELYEGVFSLKQSPTRQHLSVILSSLPEVVTEGNGQWRLKHETPTDN